jgi:Flp pilus assembly protein TadB
MQLDKQQKRLRQSDVTMRPGSPSLVAKVLAVMIGAALLVVGFAVSLVMLAVILAAGIVIGGFVWWKTRDLRKQIREQAIRAPADRASAVRVLPAHESVCADRASSTRRNRRSQFLL